MPRMQRMCNSLRLKANISIQYPERSRPKSEFRAQNNPKTTLSIAENVGPYADSPPGPRRSTLSVHLSSTLEEIPKMTEPTIAQKGPYPVEVEAGKSYFWCACGISANQPFCDGSHRGSDMVPVKFEAAESKTVYLCGCKHSASPVFCDGSHKSL
jgi:CDGSH-type Zn-finger protein